MKETITIQYANMTMIIIASFVVFLNTEHSKGPCTLSPEIFACIFQFFRIRHPFLSKGYYGCGNAENQPDPKFFMTDKSFGGSV